MLSAKIQQVLDPNKNNQYIDKERKKRKNSNNNNKHSINNQNTQIKQKLEREKKR
jgi:hypothetical protein